jgi:CHAT domain-containing protein
MQILKVNTLHSMLWKLLKWLRNICSLTHECRGALINGILELLYEILISPVANFLDGMQQEDKLIIVAPEILSDVPFAALRKLDSPVGEGYLIQSHTISVTPSLRTLQDCDLKWKELDQNFLLDTSPGTIVAVAGPAYKNKDNGTKVPIITPMGEEVNFIEELFGERYVKKLVGPAATPSEVLNWAKYPSEHQVKQVVFHIAAHGIRQDDRLDVKMGAIVLAPNGKLGIYGLLVITNADILTHSCMHIVRC